MGFFGLDRARKHEENTVLLETVYDPVRDAMICGLLDEEKIPYLRQERGSGDAMRVLTGTSLFGTDFLVAKADLARARELISLLESGEESGEDADTENNSETEK